MIAGLAEQGVTSEVANLDAPDSPWNEAAPFVTYALGPRRGPWQYSSKLMPWLLANLARFDAVVLHGLWLYHGYALCQALRRLRQQQPIRSSSKSQHPRFFVMPHGMLDPYFQKATDRKLKALRNWMYWRLLEGKVIIYADAVLFTCETERVLSRKSFSSYQPKRELVVGLGVEEPPTFVPSMREAFLVECAECTNRPYLLFLGRLHEKKGVDLLLQAYGKLARNQVSGQTIPILVVAGPGLEAAYGEHLRHLVTELPASACVLFPGMLTGAAKWGAFYNCQAFVLPSHQENFGIAVVEALACSKPVLISDQVNIWREIESAGGGLVAPDTLAGTQHLMANWYQLPEDSKRVIGERARAAYDKYFAMGPAAVKLADALKSTAV
jgi:glycosyltransferase involved in cell wall biosynthesis